MASLSFLIVLSFIINICYHSGIVVSILVLMAVIGLAAGFFIYRRRNQPSLKHSTQIIPRPLQGEKINILSSKDTALYNVE